MLKNGYGSSSGGSVSIVGAGVIKWILELFLWVCSNFWVWCDLMLMGAVLVGV